MAPAPATRERTEAGASRTGPALVVDGVTYASPGVFVGDVSMTVRGGERVGVTGLRGSGATTLARTVADAVAPDLGQVRLGEIMLRPGRCGPASATSPRTGRQKGSFRCSARRRTSS